MHISSVCFHVFQMFQTYIAKVDLNIIYVAMAIHARLKSIFQMFHLFQFYVANVLSLILYVSKVIECCTCCNAHW
jgi:hypothetical protein